MQDSGTPRQTLPITGLTNGICVGWGAICLLTNGRLVEYF